MTSDVDILLPTFDPKPTFVRRAIQSVIDQTHDNWSLYVVQDGGETALTESIQAPGDARVHLLSVPHQGKAAALNHALKHGGAKYVAYLDDDDIWYPNHLHVAISAMREGQARFVHTDAYEVFLRRTGDRYREVSRNVLNRGPVSDLLLWYVSHINTVHERSLIEEAGPYDEKRQVFIDWDMLLRMAHLSRPHHVPVITCEHNIYVDDDDKKDNRISRVHSIDPEYSRAMHDEMFTRAFNRLSSKDVVRALADRRCSVLLIKHWLRKHFHLATHERCV
jgi:glycosyltransferase involved in cell wall biosynthesis